MFNRRGDKVYGQQIPGDKVYGDEVHGDKIGGDKVHGDKIRVGDISGGSVAIGRNAQAGNLDEVIQRRAVLIGRIGQMDLAQIVTVEGLLAAAGL
jgi:hypothetical protein